jgi:23S rRNA pseudouridine1911/1915/1917 synthase
VRRRAPLLERVADDTVDGQRLDVAVASWLNEPRARVQERIAAGEVTVGGATVAKSRRISAGDLVRVAPAPPPAPVDPPPPVPIRFEDDHLAVVAKPAGLVVHPGAGRRAGGTLVDALTAMGVPLAVSADPARPGVVHRLDRGTSGVLVVAKSAAALDGLMALFRRHAIDRRYWALVDGVPDPAHATIEAPIARSTAQRTRFAVDPAGRRAVTHYDVVEALGTTAVVDVRLETGRTHQVRVHLAAVGHPVAGDATYGADPVVARALGLSRPALHARRLGFPHPVTGEAVVVDEPLPSDLAAALAAARR